MQVSRGISLTLFYEALNRRVPGDFRATVNSLVSLCVRALFIVTGPALGWVMDEYGVHTALLVLGMLFAPLLSIVVMPLVARIASERASLANLEQQSHPG